MRLLSLLAVLLAASGAFAQTIPPRGTEATFDVASWNLEHFGGTTQRQNAVEVIRQADLDLWALQEIESVTDFNLLVQDLEADGYAGILGPDAPARRGPAPRICLQDETS